MKQRYRLIWSPQTRSWVAKPLNDSAKKFIAKKDEDTFMTEVLPFCFFTVF